MSSHDTHSAANLSSNNPSFQRANAVKREPELQAFWGEERIYEKLLEDNTGEKYVLHDGPPYANGDLHIGHALNKVRVVLEDDPFGCIRGALCRLH